MLLDDPQSLFDAGARVRYVLSLDGATSFAIFGPGRVLKEKTREINNASQFDSMTEALVYGFIAGIEDFDVRPHAA